MTTIIYYLHKGDNIPFYIGKTKNNINKRQREHRLKNQNKNIILEVLDKISSYEWKFWEQYYILLFKSWGFILENKNNGGGGSSSRTDTFKNNLSQQRKGKKLLHIEKSLFQFDLEGNFIKEWESYVQAYKILKNQGISKAARGENLQAGGNIWCYKENFTPDLILEKVKKLKESTCPVYQFDINMNLIKEFRSIQEASKFLGKTASSLCECCKGKRKTAYGYIWKYKK